MIRTAGCLIFIIFHLISCESSEKPKYRLSDDRLVDMIFDMHLGEALLVDFPKHKQDSIKQVYMKRMTEAYGLNETEIREEIDKLSTEPEKMKLIISQVKSRADSLQ